jgi:cellulose synthase operon protein C
MRTLKFPSEAALRVALTSGLIPVEVLATPVQSWQDNDGVVYVVTSVPVPTNVVSELKHAGVAVSQRKTPETSVSGASWAHLIPVQRSKRELTVEGVTLFEILEESSFLALSGELLRLGCDQQSFQELGGRYWLRVPQPPYYALLRAWEGELNVRAYRPSRPGQERLWIELGYEHPLARWLASADDKVVLVDGDGAWREFPLAPWRDIYEIVDLQVAGVPQVLKSNAKPTRLRVPLRLARSGKDRPASLWVIRSNPEQVMDRLLQQLPDDIIDKLLFCMAKQGEQSVAVLRVRQGQKRPPQLVLEAESYAPHVQIPQLFVPCDRMVEPPLRRERVRELLAPDPENITWLFPTEAPYFRVETLKESSFQRLEEWVDYVIYSHEQPLEAWVRSASFKWEAYEIVGADYVQVKREAKEAKAKAQKEGTRRARESMPSLSDSQPFSVPRSEAEIKEANEAKSRKNQVKIVASQPNLVAEALAKLERAFMQHDGQADDEERLRLWEQMAEHNFALRRSKEAALCWTRAYWEQPWSALKPWAPTWVQSEIGAEATASQLKKLLADKDPDPSATRAMVSVLVAMTVTEHRIERELLAQVQNWLQKYDDVLDLRSLWFGQLALSVQVGGDSLGLTRARDRVLARLHRGLSVEKDVPAFLRFVTGRGGDSAQVEKLTSSLEALLGKLERTKRKTSPVEAPFQLTRAYIGYVFAYGMARLGRTERARVLLNQSNQALDQSDSVHQFLSKAYHARVEQAIEGLPAEIALPPEIAGELNGLATFMRYKVDRLREASSILEPTEHLDPVAAFQRAEQDPRGPEFAELRGMTDLLELLVRLSAIVAKAREPETTVADSTRLLDGAMDFFPQLAMSQALPMLRNIVELLEKTLPERQPLLLEQALMLAGHFGSDQLALQLVERLKGSLAKLGTEHSGHVARVLGGSLRTLRRVGLKDQALELLEAIGNMSFGVGTIGLISRVHVSAGWASLGKLDRALPIYNETITALEGNIPMRDRLELTRAFARALSCSPEDVSLGFLERLSNQLPTITDSFNTNSHFCLSLIHYMESLVLGYASDELAIGEFGRQWLDEDEFLIRRRVHRDLQEAAIAPEWSQRAK